MGVYTVLNYRGVRVVVKNVNEHPDYKRYEIEATIEANTLEEATHKLASGQFKLNKKG